MKRIVILVYLGLISKGEGHANVTINAAALQLREFKNEHPLPIGLATTTAGLPVDVRSTITVNSRYFENDFALEEQLHINEERIPERVVHARGNGAYGYFVVTHDVSKYTSADVFNGIGKKTPVFGRFSTLAISRGSPELDRENKGLAVKMYTKDGNLDFLCLHVPVFEYRDPIDFESLVHSVRPNPKTNLVDFTAIWDHITLRPTTLHPFLWRFSDFGIPYGYRRMDIFPIHAYVINNKHGERYVAKFNFRTELGLANLTAAEAQAIGSQDPFFFTRDVYNAIANKNYPSWRLEMDVMPFEYAKKLDYNPFDVNRLWKNGTYKTVTIGRYVFDKNSDNDFRDSEQSAFNPANLVPGIPGPVDIMFKARRLAYLHAQQYRLGTNFNNMRINIPKYKKTYTRDGRAPVKDNMNDVPNYYPNSFSGPVPYVDESRPRKKVDVLESNTVDLEPSSYFYNEIVKTDDHKQRLAANAAASLVPVDKEIVKKALKLLSYVDPDLGRRVTTSYREQRLRAEAAEKLDARTRYQPIAQCISAYQQSLLIKPKQEYEKLLPIGLATTTAGLPVDVRNTITVNSRYFENDFALEEQLHINEERIPERVVHPRANGAYGYFVVTHDVSKYTSADVFNGIGKKTPVFGRFSTQSQGRGSSELERVNKGLAVKMYTKDGNLDFLCLHVPVFEYRDPIDFQSLVHSVRPNPKTNLVDFTAVWDHITQRPTTLHPFLWRFSDYGIPYGYRRMDVFPFHAYVINNNHGERFLVKFNLRTELGLANLTTAEARAIATEEPFFFTRDLYNAIANKNYPSWRLEMDVMPFEYATKLDYDPFDVNRLWKNGTYKTVTIGRYVFDRHSDNDFRDTEQSAFSPANLVPGIPGPVDLMFKARRLAYLHAHQYRLGTNFNNIRINIPKYKKTYTRDGRAPVKDNMNDVPNYYPNSFSGPVPYVDESRPRQKVEVFQSNAVDLEPMSYFYNEIVKTDAHKQRLAENTAASLNSVDKEIVKKALQLLSYVDPDLGRRVTTSYREQIMRAEAAEKLDAKTRYQPIAQCISAYQQSFLIKPKHDDEHYFH